MIKLVRLNEAVVMGDVTTATIKSPMEAKRSLIEDAIVVEYKGVRYTIPMHNVSVIAEDIDEPKAVEVPIKDNKRRSSRS